MNTAFGSQSKTSIVAESSTMRISNPMPTTEGYFNPMPVGEKEGDLMYWNPDAGDSGAWVIISAPDPSQEEYKYLRFGENLQWGPSEFEEGVSVNDMLRWDGEKWAILPAPTSGSEESPVVLKYTGGSSIFWGDSTGLPEGVNNGDILYWNGEAWVVLPAPSGNRLRVLTIQNNNLAWTNTQDCL